MFLLDGSYRVNSTIIRGVQYVTFSFYKNDKLIFDKIGNLIEEAADQLQTVGSESQDACENSIAIESK